MPCHDADPPQISVKTMIHGLGGIGGSGGGDGASAYIVHIHVCPTPAVVITRYLNIANMSSTTRGHRGLEYTLL